MITWVGEVTWRQVAELREQLFDEMDQQETGVCVDVRLVTEIDRIGVALLVGANLRGKAIGRPLSLLDANGPVSVELTRTRLISEFTITEASTLPLVRPTATTD
jgi:ABC-type transporter Mla MlaB component